MSAASERHARAAAIERDRITRLQKIRASGDAKAVTMEDLYGRGKCKNVEETALQIPSFDKAGSGKDRR